MRVHAVHPFLSFHPERLAQIADPKLVLASLVPFCAGAALAFDQRGSIDIGLGLVVYVAIFLMALAYAPVSLARPGWNDLALGVIYGPVIVVGSLLTLKGVLTAEAMIVSVTLGLLMAATAARHKTTLLIIAFAVPLVWAVYAGPFRLTAVFAGIPAAMLTSERDEDDPWLLATFALTGLALSAAIAWL
jgi:hypothetical protein